MTLTQLVIALMGPPLTAAALVTLIVAFIPILLDTTMLAVALRPGTRTNDRIIVAVLGVLGLFAWAYLSARRLPSLLWCCQEQVGGKPDPRHPGRR